MCVPFFPLHILAAASGGDAVTVPPLGYKKWGLVDQGMVTDCIAPGLCPPSIYDHMAQTSVARGFNHTVFTGMFRIQGIYSELTLFTCQL